jgi:hypothetical protein
MVHCSDRKSIVSEQLLRLQYSLAIVRFVNGVADSAQKGRVAVSVAGLARQAEVPRLLVDIRHESTHNELPSLQVLRVAAEKALDWLLSKYWRAQHMYLMECQTKIDEVVGKYIESHIHAIIKEVVTTEQPEYDFRKEKKLRQALCTELRTLVPRGSELHIVKALCSFDMSQYIGLLSHTGMSEDIVSRSCRRVLEHLAYWADIAPMLLDSFLQNGLRRVYDENSKGHFSVDVSTDWFVASLDLVSPSALESIVVSCIQNHAEHLHRKHIDMFIEICINEDTRSSIEVIFKVFHKDLVRLFEQSSASKSASMCAEFSNLFLTIPTTQELLDRMERFLEKSKVPKNEKSSSTWIKMSSWAPCAIGLSPSDHISHGILPCIIESEYKFNSVLNPFGVDTEDSVPFIVNQYIDDDNNAFDQEEYNDTQSVDSYDCPPPASLLQNRE